jgi:hypothetical protein
VSAETCRRYERLARVLVQPVYLLYPLSWPMLESIVPDEPLAGTFLEDGAGKRYPPLLSIARKLLAQRQTVVFKRQVTNHYQVLPDSRMSPIGDNLSPVPAAPLVPKVSRALNPVAAAVAACAAAYDGAHHAIHILIQRDNMGRSVPMPISSSHIPPQAANGEVKSVQRTSLRTRLAKCAQSLYDAVRQRNPQKSLTLAAALSLVKEFGIALVERCLRVIARRSDLYNPAGFIKVWLRGERLRAVLEGKSDPASIPAKSKPARSISDLAEAAAQAAWIDRLRSSPYAAFYANAADFAG